MLDYRKPPLIVLESFLQRVRFTVAAAAVVAAAPMTHAGTPAAAELQFSNRPLLLFPWSLPLLLPLLLALTLQSVVWRRG